MLSRRIRRHRGVPDDIKTPAAAVQECSGSRRVLLFLELLVESFLVLLQGVLDLFLYLLGRAVTIRVRGNVFFYGAEIQIPYDKHGNHQND